MTSHPHPRTVQSVLFVCTMNAVRSPMASALVRHFHPNRIFAQSAGTQSGSIDGLAIEVMHEMQVDLARHIPKTIYQLGDTFYDLIVTLSAEAHESVHEYSKDSAQDIEFWPTTDPTIIEGSRNQKLDAYRAVRDGLIKRIKERFPLKYSY